jgi:hypothetical protein
MPQRFNSDASVQAVLIGAAEDWRHDAQPYTYIQPPSPGRAAPPHPSLSVAAQVDDGDETTLETDDEQPKPEDGVVAIAAPCTPPPEIVVAVHMGSIARLSAQGRRMWWPRPGSQMTGGTVAATSRRRATSAVTPPRGSLKRKNAFDWGR